MNSKQFVIVPKSFIDRLPELSKSEIAVFLYLSSCLNGEKVKRGDYRVWPTNETIAAAIGMSVAIVKLAKTKLIELGFIVKVERRFNSSSVITLGDGTQIEKANPLAFTPKEKANPQIEKANPLASSTGEKANPLATNYIKFNKNKLTTLSNNSDAEQSGADCALRPAGSNKDDTSDITDIESHLDQFERGLINTGFGELFWQFFERANKPITKQINDSLQPHDKKIDRAAYRDAIESGVIRPKPFHWNTDNTVATGVANTNEEESDDWDD